MQEPLTIERLEEIRGATVYDSSGDKIGKVDEIFYDTDTRDPEWIGLGTGFFGTRHVLVPASTATIRDGEVTVPYTKAQVKDSPDLVEGDEISPSNEQELHRYYGLEGGADPATRDAGETRTAGGETGAGRVRVRRWVEEERVSPGEGGAGRRTVTETVRTERVFDDVENVDDVD